MASRILRPTPPGGRKQQQPWIIQGLWGKRDYGPLAPSEFYGRVHDELVESKLLSPDALRPSRKYHQEVTWTVQRASWIDGLGWVPDEPLADRLRRLRHATGLSQERFAEQHGLSAGTIKALESGVRGSNATWTTLCAIAEALDKPVTVFCGVEGVDLERGPRAAESGRS